MADPSADQKVKHRWSVDGLPLLTPERLEQLHVIREEMSTIEIPAPIHYPPSPPGDIECYEFMEDEEDEDVVPATPLPPVTVGRRQELGPNGLPTSFSFACGGWLQVSVSRTCHHSLGPCQQESRAEGCVEHYVPKQFFLFGAARCIKDHGLHVGAQFAGCSAGKLVQW
jgi:hypothetical protein